MFILSHLIAALASVLPLLLAIQKGRNGGFDYIYQRTIDYTSSFQVQNVLGFLLPNQYQDFVASVVVPVMNVTSVTISQPEPGQIDMHLDEQTAYLNVSGEPSYTAPNPRSGFQTYRQAASYVVDAWLGFSKYVLLVFDGLIRVMEDLKDFSTELHVHHYDFSHTSTPRTRKVLVVAYVSLLRSLVRKVLPLSLVVAMLLKLFAVVFFMVSIGLGYYVYTLLQDLAKEKSDLKQQETAFMQLVAHAETLRKDLDQQIMLLDEKEENLKIRGTEESQLQAHAYALEKDLDQRTKQLIESQEGLKIYETITTQLRAHATSLQRDLDQQKKLLVDGQEESKRHERTADQLRAHAESLQQDLDARTKKLVEGQEILKQQETAAEDPQKHADTLQHDLEQQKKLLEDQRHEIEEFQAFSKRQLRNAQAKIVSLEDEMQAQLERHGEAQEKALEQAQEETQRLRAGNRALDEALTTERQRSYQAHDQARAMKTKHTDLTRRLTAVNVSYESQKQTLKQRTAQIEELTSERDELAQRVSVTEAAVQKLRESFQKLEIDFTNKVSTITSLEQQLQEARAKFDQRAAELSMSHSKSELVNQKLMEADSRSQSLEDEVKRLEGDLSRKSSAADKYKQQAAGQQSISEQKAAERTNLQSKLDQVCQELAAAHMAEKALGARVKGLEVDLSHKSSAVETLELQVEQLRNASEQDALVIPSLSAELVALRHENTEARAKEESLLKRTEGLEKDLEIKTSAIETLEAQAQQDRRSLGQNTRDLTTAEARVAALRQDNEMARARAEKLQERLCRLEHDLDVNVSSVQAYERNSEHQERVLEGRNVELAQALELVESLEGQLETLRTEVGTRGYGDNNEADQPPVRGNDEDDSVPPAEANAKDLAHGADPAHHAPPAAQDIPEMAEGAEEQEEASARKRGHRSKRRRGGKRQAAKRQPIPRRHSFDSHAHKSCSRCGGPLPVKVICVPKKVRPGTSKKSAEPAMSVRIRRHSLDSPTHKRCPECGGSLPVEVTFASEARTAVKGEGARAASAGEVTSAEARQTATSQGRNSPQSAEVTVPAHSGHALTSPMSGTSSHAPQQDECSEVNGAQDQAAGQSADTPSAQPRRRRRHRAKGRKANNEQEQNGELDSQQASTEAQDVTQSLASTMLASRWVPEGSASPQPNLPPPGPSRLFSR